MKKFFVLALVAMLALGAMACAGKTAEPVATTAPAAATAAPAAETAAPVEVSGPIAEQPALLTSAGQSADIEMVRVLLEKKEIRVSSQPLATSADIGTYKTLVVAIGGSSKGLGAAGIDEDQELARLQELLKAADEKGLVIIAVHIGGEARRGALSDKFIAPTFEVADCAVVASAGDADGLMSGLAAGRSIPYIAVANMSSAMGPLADLFVK